MNEMDQMLQDAYPDAERMDPCEPTAMTLDEALALMEGGSDGD